MFTIEQIKAAHSRVKSGADFPGYIKEMGILGVEAYSYAVSDGSTTYLGANDFAVTAPPKYALLHIAGAGAPEILKHDLKIHQAGGSDFLTFCQQTASAGVMKWTVDIKEMTCTYFDLAGNNMLTEVIPEA